jgi:hypothetical protein
MITARWPTGIATQWKTIQGKSLQGPALIPDLGEVQQVLPRGEAWPAVLFKDGTVRVGDFQDQLKGDGILAPSADNGLVWRTLTQDGPVSDRPIQVQD